MNEQQASTLVHHTWYAYAYLASNAFSILGNSLMAVVLPVLIISRLGSPTWAGVVAVATTSAQMFAGFLGGALTDRVNRRNLSLTADLLSTLSVISLFLVDWFTMTSVLWFIVLGTIGAFADMPGQTARQALGPQVATSSSITYEKITGYFQTLQGGALIIGPVLAGVFLLLPNPAWALILAGSCSFLAAFTTALMPHTIGEYRREEHSPSVIHQTTHAISLIRHTPLLRFALTFAVGINVLHTITQSFVLPTHYALTGQANRVGWIIALMGVGMIIGGLIFGLLSAKLARSTLFLTATCLSLIGAILVLSLWDLSAVLNGAAILGVGFAIINASATIAAMDSLPEGNRGAVMGIILTLILTAYPLGFGLATLLYTYSGLGAVRLVLAGGFTSITLWALVSKRSHTLNAITAQVATPRSETSPPSETTPGAHDALPLT
ncbi:MFS transporter [Arcanobacterium phocisimile]|uniref:MFS transporter n=1 Tax=Arcanobacterium phocisimile TaxID=1302235 RepID=A0ABX7IIS2_9ACTO|nr:MFS transporter [Arcanobacterium phocisimile]QRV01748.1 MFS transporter [Arcanobacterium phocisimile]